MESRLWAPSTFSEYHVGDSTTWISTYGYAHRLDYVVIPFQWQDYQIKSYVQHQVDLSLARHDHFVAAVEVLAIKASVHDKSS